MTAFLDNALQEIGEHIDALDKHGLGYAKRYAEAVMVGGICPKRPVEIHPLLAEMIRDVVLEASLAARGSRTA